MTKGKSEPESASGFTLYHYWRSSSSWRVRWALAEKGIEPKYVAVNLLDGESEGADHRNRNPFGYVPVLQLPANPYAGAVLVESMAIIEWLDEMYPANSLLSGDSFRRAHIRALCEFINAGTQPVANLNVLDYLVDNYGITESQKINWIQNFIHNGLSAFETYCKGTHGLWSVGDQVTAADLFLIPQCYNALRFGMDLSHYPIIQRIWQVAEQHQACKATHPDRFKPH